MIITRHYETINNINYPIDGIKDKSLLIIVRNLSARQNNLTLNYPINLHYPPL